MVSPVFTPYCETLFQPNVEADALLSTKFPMCLERTYNILTENLTFDPEEASALCVMPQLMHYKGFLVSFPGKFTKGQQHF